MLGSTWRTRDRAARRAPLARAASMKSGRSAAAATSLSATRAIGAISTIDSEMIAFLTPGPERRADRDGQQDRREGVEDVERPHDRRCGPSGRDSPATRPRPVPIERRDQHRDEPGEQRRPGAPHQPAEDVAALAVGAQQVAGGADVPEPLGRSSRRSGSRGASSGASSADEDDERDDRAADSRPRSAGRSRGGGRDAPRSRRRPRARRGRSGPCSSRAPAGRSTAWTAVDEQVDEDERDRRDQHPGLDHRHVPGGDRLVDQQPEPGPGEDRLDEQDPAEQVADLQAGDRQQRRQRVVDGVADDASPAIRPRARRLLTNSCGAARRDSDTANIRAMIPIGARAAAIVGRIRCFSRSPNPVARAAVHAAGRQPAGLHREQQEQQRDRVLRDRDRGDRRSPDASARARCAGGARSTVPRATPPTRATISAVPARIKVLPKRVQHERSPPAAGARASVPRSPCTTDFSQLDVLERQRLVEAEAAGQVGARLRRGGRARAASITGSPGISLIVMKTTIETPSRIGIASRTRRRTKRAIRPAAFRALCNGQRSARLRRRYAAAGAA